MKISNDLKNMTIAELNQEILVLRKRQFNLRFSTVNESLKQTHLFSQIRHNIAQIKTLITLKGSCYEK